MFKKESKHHFFEPLISSDTSLLGILFLLKRKKFDYLIITKKRILYIIRNKVIKNISYNYDLKIDFNSVKNSIEFYSGEQKKEYIELNDFRITTEEIQQIKRALN
ncbi:hypothetical protein [Flavivirga spongiicola]|uniref:YokE-like PH domain-containing protein n=1 Tax=Flavivirga spongiicola TaxID=421621 RepID=A0ABU7XVZ9_9FLAO|nr:hypothetical protein [Flavivirga sp. MEBiC05379]MDO5979932.1 hypothetical protein [Flavivirga sp. MEBiC05379]